MDPAHLRQAVAEQQGDHERLRAAKEALNRALVVRDPVVRTLAALVGEADGGSQAEVGVLFSRG